MIGANGSEQLSEEAGDALFIDWSNDRASASRRPLAEWLSAHPAAAADLIAWTADEPVIADAEAREPDPSLVSHAEDAGLRALADLRARMTPASRTAAIQSLLVAAKTSGFSPATLALRLGVGVSIVAKLQQRLLRAATVPEELIRNLADALKADVQQVRDYIALPPTLAVGSEYKASGVPKVGEQQDFDEAIRTSLDMSPAAKARWSVKG